MSKKLNVGVIGVGGIANTHFPGWEKSPHTQVVALADVNADTLKRIGEAQKVTRLFNDPLKLIAEKDIDIIDICTPNMYHAPLAIAAMKAGKHVICEKPLAPTPQEVLDMIAARDAAGTMLMTAQHFRFMGSTRALKAEIERGTLGTIYHARSWMLRRAGVPLSPTFLQKKHAGGGPCIDIGVHILDLTLWLMGNPKPVTVSGITQDRLSRQPGAFSAWGGAIPSTMDVEEFAACFVRFDNGATLMLETSWMLHHKTPGEDMQLWLYGEKAGAHWPHNELVSANNETQQHYAVQLQRAEPDDPRPHARECMAFADAIVNGKPSPVPAEQSLDVITILDGLYRSAAAGKEIDVRR